MILQYEIYENVHHTKITVLELVQLANLQYLPGLSGVVKVNFFISVYVDLFGAIISNVIKCTINIRISLTDL